jgi:hypothetical protein
MDDKMVGQQNRTSLIGQFRRLLEPMATVHAMWLEGADANGHLDDYSDIDLYVDVDDEAIEAVLQALEQHFTMDCRHENQSGNACRQIVYHIAGTSEYWMIDFNVQPHSNDSKNSTFERGDLIDVCKVLFDKSGVIRIKEVNLEDYRQEQAFWLDESDYRFSQLSRVKKYVLRDQYPEAWIYYFKYVVEPLTALLRILYTPTKLGYHLVHISQHLPDDQTARLTRILQIGSLADIDRNLNAARDWYQDLRQAIDQMT